MHFCHDTKPIAVVWAWVVLLCVPLPVAASVVLHVLWVVARFSPSSVAFCVPLSQTVCLMRWPVVCEVVPCYVYVPIISIRHVLRLIPSRFDEELTCNTHQLYKPCICPVH